MKYKISNAFTLVELLMVLGLIGILLGIGLPAFTKLMKGGAVDGGARTVSAMIALTRSYAITNNCKTALLIPKSATDEASFDYAYKNLIPASVWKNGGVWTFGNFFEGENWRKIPTGALIAASAGASPESLVAGSTTVTNVDLSGVGGGATGYQVANSIIFKSNGSVEGTVEPEIVIREGSFDGGNVVSTGAENKITLKVNLFTGRSYYVND